MREKDHSLFDVEERGCDGPICLVLRLGGAVSTARDSDLVYSMYSFHVLSYVLSSITKQEEAVSDEDEQLLHAIHALA